MYLNHTSLKKKACQQQKKKLAQVQIIIVYLSSTLIYKTETASHNIQRGDGWNISVQIRPIPNQGENIVPDPSIQWYLMGPLQYCRTPSLYMLPSKYNLECIFFPQNKMYKTYIFYATAFLSWYKGETEVFQATLQNSMGSSGKKLWNTWLSLFLFRKIIKIVLNLKYFVEHGILLNQTFHRCKLFNCHNCNPPDSCRLIWSETELNAFQVLPITIS